MDLSTRKHHFIEALMTVEKESVMGALERVLKPEKEAQQRKGTETFVVCWVRKFKVMLDSKYSHLICNTYKIGDSPSL